MTHIIVNKEEYKMEKLINILRKITVMLACLVGCLLVDGIILKIVAGTIFGFYIPPY